MNNGELLEGLEKARCNEDELILVISQVISVLLPEADIPAAAQERITRILEVLKEDTAGHQRVLDGLIAAVRS